MFDRFRAWWRQKRAERAAASASDLLPHLRDVLRSSGVPEVADARIESGRVQAWRKRLLLEASVRDVRTGSLHVHVVAWVGGRAGAHHLEACLVGFGDSVAASARDAAELWLALAGAPILSSLAARPLLQADHFEGDEPWGIPGGHGFVGPFILRGDGNEQIDLDLMARAPAFQIEGYPRDQRVHLAKVTLLGMDGRWKREVELDGHTCLHSETDWDADQPVPEGVVIATRFALFFAGDVTRPT